MIKVYQVSYRVLSWLSFLASIYLGFKAGYFIQGIYGFPWNYIALILVSLCSHILIVKVAMDKVVFRKLTDRFTPVFEYNPDQGSIRFDDEVQYIPWCNVVKIEILTTDRGPWEEDVWWLFHLVDVEDAIVIPQGVKNHNDIFKVLESYFTDVDMESLMKGLTSVENAVFRVWQAKKNDYDVD